MASNYPGSLDSYSTKSSGDTIAEGHINDPQDAVEAIEAKVGTGASTPTDSNVMTGTGVGTSAWGKVELAAMVSGILPSANLPVGTCVINSGTYTGNGTAGTAVAHGLGVTPSYVTVSSILDQQDFTIWITGMGANVRWVEHLTTVESSISAPNSTNFYLAGNNAGNRTGVTYYWVAYGKIV